MHRATRHSLDPRIILHSLTDHLRPDERTEQGCPACKEDRIDWLLWVDDEQVRCLSCGQVYQP